jgi:hypothetical protein
VFYEELLAEFVEVADELATKIARTPDQQPLELHPAESVPHRRFEDSKHLANAGLTPPDPVTRMSRRGEAGDKRSVEVEKGADAWS